MRPLCRKRGRPGDAEVQFTITNGGADVGGKGEAHFYSPGNHGGGGIDWARSGNAVHVPPGSYDVHVTFMDGTAAKDIWLTNQNFSGKVQKTVEIALPVAEVSYIITNSGADVGGKGEAHFYPPGKHGGGGFDWIRSGGSAHMPAGNYDVHVTFMDGTAVKDLWLNNQSFSGKVQKTVEIAAPVAEVSYVITNSGVDVKDKGEAHFYPHGHHDGAAADWSRSGGTVHVPAAAYDVAVMYRDGMIKSRSGSTIRVFPARFIAIMN